MQDTTYANLVEVRKAFDVLKAELIDRDEIIKHLHAELKSTKHLLHELQSKVQNYGGIF